MKGRLYSALWMLVWIDVAALFIFMIVAMGLALMRFRSTLD